MHIKPAIEEGFRLKINIKEVIRWTTFIPLPLVAGPVAATFLFLPTLFNSNISSVLFDVPIKIIFTSCMWIVTFWLGAFLKPKNLSFDVFKVIWIILSTLIVSKYLISNASWDWRYQFIEIFIPIYFFSYRKGNYSDQETFMRTVNLRILNGLGFNKEEKLIGYFGWSLPTLFFALYLLLEVIFFTFKGFPFAILSFIGAIALNTAVSTTLYSQDPAFKQNPSGKYLMGLGFLLVGLFLVRISGLNSISFLDFSINLYILPCLLGLTYYPGNDPKDFE